MPGAAIWPAAAAAAGSELFFAALLARLSIWFLPVSTFDEIQKFNMQVDRQRQTDSEPASQPACQPAAR